jgi:hypothetical protein
MNRNRGTQAEFQFSIVSPHTAHDLVAIREIADRLDGKPAQVIDRRGLPLEQLTDSELLGIAAGGLPGRKENEAKILLLPPGPSSER